MRGVERTGLSRPLSVKGGDLSRGSAKRMRGYPHASEIDAPVVVDDGMRCGKPALRLCSSLDPQPHGISRHQPFTSRSSSENTSDLFDWHAFAGASFPN